VTKVTYGFAGKYVKVGTVNVEGIFVNVAKGPMAFSLVNGRYPKGNDQLLLGATTMSQAHLHVGSRVSVSLVNKSGKVESRTLQVVGTVTLPPTFSIGGLGVGAVLPFGAALDIACLGNPHPSACHQELAKSVQGGAWRWALCPDRPDVPHSPTFSASSPKTSMNSTCRSTWSTSARPWTFLSCSRHLGPLGAATLAHLLFVSVARRRRQVALLKVLGFVRRQVLASTCWQALTVVAIGLLIACPRESRWERPSGGPSRPTWGRYRWQCTVELVAIVCVVIVVGGVALALLPALLAVRVQPAEALREA